MSDYASVDDVIKLGRTLTPEETTRAEALIPIISARLRTYAANEGKDFDQMIAKSADLALVAKQVTVDVVLRALATPTSAEPATQFTETAGPYSLTATPFNPSRGLFISKNELALLGLRSQQVKNVELI